MTRPRVAVPWGQRAGDTVPCAVCGTPFNRTNAQRMAQRRACSEPCIGQLRSRGSQSTRAARVARLVAYWHTTSTEERRRRSQRGAQVANRTRIGQTLAAVVTAGLASLATGGVLLDEADRRCVAEVLLTVYKHGYKNGYGRREQTERVHRRQREVA